MKMQSCGEDEGAEKTEEYQLSASDTADQSNMESGDD